MHLIVVPLPSLITLSGKKSTLQCTWWWCLCLQRGSCSSVATPTRAPRPPGQNITGPTIYHVNLWNTGFLLQKICTMGTDVPFLVVCSFISKFCICHTLVSIWIQIRPKFTPNWLGCSAPAVRFFYLKQNWSLLKLSCLGNSGSANANY